ncbi:hypothetical protein LR48_Vigan02g256100 [Vigna angularis]|uniref:Uncharacterized protein n=1 Tax=Phaseolus angularis TaxID=3914 RepID=A0A0L9U0W2_PHAAN|nr:hypothetical protein LR48_Vigan02g256100 [Vigna angularis]
MHCSGAFESATGFFSVSGVNFFIGLRPLTVGRTLLPAGTSTGRTSGSAIAKFMDRTLGARLLCDEGELVVHGFTFSRGRRWRLRVAVTKVYCVGMEVSGQNIAKCDEEKTLKCLLDAFGSAFSLEEIASAYNADLAGEILFEMQGSFTGSSSTLDYPMQMGLLKDGYSIENSFHERKTSRPKLHNERN